MSILSKRQEKSLTHCLATRCSDQMICGECGTQWDINDPDKPECKFDLQQEINNLSECYQYCDRSQRFDLQQKIVDKKNRLLGFKTLTEIKENLKLDL